MKLFNIICSILLFTTQSQYLDSECPDLNNIPQDRRQDKNKLRLMQYNVEWFFLDYYSGSDCPEMAVLGKMNRIRNSFKLYL